MMHWLQTAKRLNRYRPLVMLFLLLAVVLLVATVPVTVAQAQDEQPPPPAAGPAEDIAYENLASKFFIARKTDVNGERSVEILGSLVIWLLLLLSAVSIGLIGSLALTNQRKAIVPTGVVEELRRLLDAGKFREALQLVAEDQSFFSKIAEASLSRANQGFAAVARTLEQTADEMTTVRLRRVEYLNVLGQVSPMIGLFGTVYGMILAFQAIVITGGNANPVMLAGGIGTALTTTFWGLVVAIPALAGYAIIRNRVDELTTEATLAAEDLINQFRPKLDAAVASRTKRGSTSASEGGSE